MYDEQKTDKDDSDDVQGSPSRTSVKQTSVEARSETNRCIGVCTLDEDGEYCTACGQSIEELQR